MIRVEFDPRFALNLRTIALAQFVPVQAYKATRDMQPAAPTLSKLVAKPLAFGQFAGIDGDILVDGDSAIATPAVGDEPQAAFRLLAREALLFVARVDSLCFRDDPDLQEVCTGSVLDALNSWA